LLSRSDDETSVQLADFTYAVTKSEIENDSEVGDVLRMALPAETVAPEVSTSNVTVFVLDCLFVNCAVLYNVRLL